MKTRKRASSILIVLLCAALIVMTFGACGGSDNKTTAPADSKPAAENTSTDGDTAEKGSLYIEGSEGVTLTYWIPMTELQTQNFGDLNEHPYFQWLEEQTGVHIEFIHPSWEQTEQQMNMMLASGKFYDILFYPEYPGGPQMGIDEGCYLDLKPYLDEYMPDYKRALYCDDGSFADWEWGPEKELYQPAPQPSFLDTCTTASGAVWCVSQIWTNVYPSECGPVVRKDWLDEAGLDVPQTLDELETVLEAFKNRGDDVIPMNLGKNGGNGNDGSIISAFDLFANFFTVTDNQKTVRPHAYTQDEYKDYLLLMHDWYSKGYIDKDFMNRDDDSLNALFMDDRLGVYMDQWHTPDWYMENYTGSDENFEVVAMTLPRKTKDQQLHWANFYLSSVSQFSCITTSCEHPEIAAQWLNVGFTKEGILRSSYGVEGETYELKDGVPYFLPSVFEEDSQYIWDCVLYPSNSTYCSSRISYLLADPNAATEPSAKAKASIAWTANADSSYVWPFTTFSDDGWGQFDGALNDAKTYGDPMVIKFIIGEEDIESKFDEFKENCKKLGMDEAQRVAQEARDES